MDSQVALGAVVKGRAASAKLNGVLRRTMAYPIGSDIYSLPMYFNTASNRADGPTRDALPQPPDLELPWWWSQFENGDFAEFDKWLESLGAQAADERLPYCDIAGTQDLDLRPKRQLKKRTSESSSSESVAHVKKATRKDLRDDSESCSCRHPEPLSAGSETAEKNSSLHPEAIELLRSFPASQFFFSSDFKDFDSPGSIDLFSGRYGVAKQLIRAGSPWVLTFEWNHSAAENLLDPSVRTKIVRLIELGAILSLSAAPICCSFSVAVTPPVRSKKYPRGIPGLRSSMRQKVREGNSHSDFLADLVVICEAAGVGFTVENPDTSWFWRQRRWKRFRSSASGCIFRLCFCRFGTRWKKPTRIATNTRLAGQRMMCQCKQLHLQLRGMHPQKKIPWTLVAQPYPQGLCSLLAVALAQKAGWCRHERLNVAACSKTGNLRAGEATNPGPRRRGVAHRPGSLFDTQLVTPQTLELEAKQLRYFQLWCSESLVDIDLQIFFTAVPQFLSSALVAYADELYRTGGALSNLRHLILAAQRWIPGSKIYMDQAWQMVERWEVLNPVKHRAPVPESLVQCMCFMAWQEKWYSWVGATLLAFYGAGRLGEVLRCSREDLVLPEDVLEAAGSPVFLRLRSFKSRMRQPAKIQHMKVVDPLASRLLSKIFRNLAYDQPLFATTPYQYRKRWDLLLSKLDIGKDSSITPGGLRGGAAVYHYKRNRPIQDLLWLLRLRSQTTLECYLQEVAALNTFAKLSEFTRNSILLCASCFAFLTAGDCT
eukprot:s1087_g22.t2